MANETKKYDTLITAFADVLKKALEPTGVQDVRVRKYYSYNMCEPQPVQLDCRINDCKYHANGGCINAAPAIKFDKTTVLCYSYCSIIEQSQEGGD
jgi:hypothetical protein